MLVTPVRWVHRLYTCDVDGNPVPRGGGTVFLNPNLWRLAYTQGRIVAVARCLPIIELLHRSAALMVVRCLTSYTWERGYVETNLGPIQGYAVPPLVIPAKFRIVSEVVDLDEAPPLRIVALAF